MKAIKRIIVPVLISVLLLSTSLTANAFDEEFIADMESMGYVYCGNGCFGLPVGTDVPSFFAIIDEANATPLYPDFDVSKFPWDETPSYIQDIVFSNMDSYTSSEPKVPFVLLSVSSDFVNVWVGTNLFLGSRFNHDTGVYSDYIRVGALLARDGNSVDFESKCYFASYYYSADEFTLNTSWSVRNSELWGTLGNAESYSTNILMSSRDTYLFGGNYVGHPEFKAFNFELGSIYSAAITLSPYGFASGLNLGVSESLPNYFKVFTPPTLEQLEEETQKGIWESIKEIPDKIGVFFESLKNYLLYFQETEPEHVNPFAGILDDVQSFFDEQIGDTEDFKASLDDTLDKVSSYIETGSNIINKILDGVPILNAFVIFFLVLAVVRKVVGR